MNTHLPFRLAGGANPLIVIPGRLNGEGPFEFVLDTGASMCLASRGAAARAGVELVSEKQAMGAGGTVTISLGRAASVEIGGRREENLDLAVTDELARVGAAIGVKVDAVLGFNFLKHYRMTLDYGEQNLRLARPEEGAAESALPGTMAQRFTLAAPAKPLILVPAHLNGQGPFTMAVDTGASLNMLSSKVAERLELPTVKAKPVTGGGGQLHITKGMLESVAVGEAVVREQEAGVGEFVNMLSRALHVELDGILGYNFLKKFLVTIDYPRSVLELTRNAEADPGQPDMDHREHLLV